MKPFHLRAPMMPPHPTSEVLNAEVGMKPDLQAVAFSPQSAYFFAHVSQIAYKPEHEARGLVVGNSTSEGLGFDRFHWFEGGEEARKSPFDAIHDTEAFVAANDDMIIVVFRGTKEISDWITNLNVFRRKCPKEWNTPYQGGEIHQGDPDFALSQGRSEKYDTSRRKAEQADVERLTNSHVARAFGPVAARTNNPHVVVKDAGFDDGVNSVWTSSGMYETINSLYNEKGKDRKLFIAGHSLGGALATIAGARLALGDQTVNTMKISGIYTFGSPRVFDKVAAKAFDETVNDGILFKDKCFRCRNNNDIVPRTPSGPYTHVGTEVYFDRFGVISTTSLADRLLGRFSAYLRGDFIEDIHDHATSEYKRLLKKAVINSRTPLSEKFSSVVADTLKKVHTASPKAASNGQPQNEMRKTQQAELKEAKRKAREAARDF